VLRHRILLTYEALAASVTPDQIVERIVAAVEAPRVAPVQDEGGAASPSLLEAAG
jgi:hypothetical protein